MSEERKAARDVKATTVVDAILDELQGRGGFDGWWCDIDAATKAEIRLSLIDIVVDHMEDA